MDTILEQCCELSEVVIGRGAARYRMAFAAEPSSRIAIELLRKFMRVEEIPFNWRSDLIIHVTPYSAFNAFATSSNLGEDVVVLFQGLFGGTSFLAERYAFSRAFAKDPHLELMHDQLFLSYRASGDLRVLPGWPPDLGSTSIFRKRTWYTNSALTFVLFHELGHRALRHGEGSALPIHEEIDLNGTKVDEIAADLMGIALSGYHETVLHGALVWLWGCAVQELYLWGETPPPERTHPLSINRFHAIYSEAAHRKKLDQSLEKAFELASDDFTRLRTDFQKFDLRALASSSCDIRRLGRDYVNRVISGTIAYNS